jgi:putative spermidine/putrescine transport system ATP-binding protein
LRQSVAREIRQLQRARGLTALMVTHDQEEAMTMADRLVVMRDGRVQQIGAQEELYEQPANPFVASFIGHSNLISGKLVGDDRLQLPDGTVIRLAARYQSRGRHTLAIRPERIQLRTSIDPAGAGVGAVVKDATYVGSHVDYLLGLGAETSISVHDLAGVHRNARHAAGAELSITWDAVNEHLFDDSDVPVRPDLARPLIKQAN